MGSAFGYYFAGYAVVLSVPFFVVPGLAPLVDALSFYTLILKYIVVFSLTFTTPAYVVVLVRYRKKVALAS